MTPDKSDLQTCEVPFGAQSGMTRDAWPSSQPRNQMMLKSEENEHAENIKVVL